MVNRDSDCVNKQKLPDMRVSLLVLPRVPGTE